MVIHPYTFGIDIGGTSAKLGLFRLMPSDAGITGNLVATRSVPTAYMEEGDEILPNIALTMHQMMDEESISAEDLAGVGIGVPGAVINHEIVNRCVNLGWDVRNVAVEFRQITGVENVKVGNDANLAALGEVWQGSGKGYDSAIMLTIGTGVGGGVIYKGEIIEGAFGAGGEVGHMHMVDDEPLTCGCGNHGCLEQYASATGIVRLTKEAIKKGELPTTLKAKDIKGAKEVFDAAREGDELALSVVSYTGEMLGKALSIMSCVLDPQVYIIGGGVAHAGNLLLDPIKSSFAEHAFHASRGAEIRLAELGNTAGMYGAARLVL